MHEPEIVLNAFFETDEELPESVMPGPGTLDHPAASWMAPGPREVLATVPDMGSIAARLHGHGNLGEVIPFVQAQMLGGVRGGAWPVYGHAIQRLRRRFHVVTVGGGHHDGQRDAPLIGQGMPFRAALPPIRRIGACFRPPNGAFTITLSSDCQRHPMPRSSSYRVSRRAQSRSKTPASTHAWKRRWQVEPEPYSRGSAFHWQPVRSTYSTPSSTWRKGTIGRPGVPGGFVGGKSGWSSAQKSSGIRQIVRSECFVLFSVIGIGDLCYDEGAITDHREYTTSTRVLG